MHAERRSATNSFPTAIQVADAVADARLQQWADVLCKRAAQCAWSDARGEAMHESLLGLPENMRAAVPKQMLQDLPRLAVPPCLHSSIVAAMIDSDGRLEGPEARHDAD
eukprot:jgi/Ulvmu1/12227/UM086_0017.1